MFTDVRMYNRNLKKKVHSIKKTMTLKKCSHTLRNVCDIQKIHLYKLENHIIQEKCPDHSKQMYKTFQKMFLCLKNIIMILLKTDYMI